MPLRARPLVVAAIVFAMSMALSVALWQHKQQGARTAQKVSLDFKLRELSSRVEQHMAAYEQMVRGVNGFLAEGNHLDRKRFGAYFESLALGPDFAGIEAIGFAKIVMPQELSQHVQTMRTSGLTAYDIQPMGDRDRFAPIVQIEPHVDSHAKLYGYDPSTNIERQKAMVRAAESGSPSIGRGTNLQSRGTKIDQGNCVLYLPLYRSGATPNTPQERRDAIVGWTFAIIKIGDLMASLYGERQAELHIALHDSVNLNPENLLYASGKPGVSPDTEGLEATEYLSIGGAIWVLTVRARPNASELAGYDQSRSVLLAGALLSFLLALVFWQMLSAKNYAVSLASTMTVELRQSEELARHSAQHDALTLLPNRALFSDRITQALQLARRDQMRLALLYIDLDNFKPINDTYGHSTGDRVLQAVALRLSNVVRKSDTVGRIGGDEFVVLLSVITSDDDVRTVGAKVLESLSAPMEIDDKQVAVSASIGVATYPENGPDEVAMFKAADLAMYKAKANHRSCVAWATAPTPLDLMPA